MHIRVGGVPEHFNHPWHLALIDGSFSNIGIELEWSDVPGGTGAMCNKLRNDELDLAIVLTEGIVADIINGNPSLIVQKFVKSPLIWGIHATPQSKFVGTDSLAEARFAISRYGSGSQIMAAVLANQNHLKLSPEQLVETRNLDGALEALDNGRADLLLWEKFTTMPYVSSGRLKRIGETVTPWPCFVIAVRQEMLLKNPDRVWNLLWLIRKISRHFMHDDQAPNIIAQNYGLQPADAQMWFNQTEWEQDVYISKKMLNNVVNTLLDIQIISKKVAAEDLCWNRSIVY